MSKVAPQHISAEKALDSATFLKKAHHSSSLTFLWLLCSLLAKSHEILLTLLSWGFYEALVT